MIKNFKDFTEEDRLKALEKVNDFLEQKSPRKIPESFKRYCISLMKCFDISFSVVGVAGLILLFILIFIEGYSNSFIVLFPSIVIAFLFAYLMYFAITYWTRINILKSGEIHQASIRYIEKKYVAKFQVPVYKLDLKVETKKGSVFCHSYIRDEVIDHFYEIMNSQDQNDIEVLYNGGEEVILPLSLVYMETVIKMSSLYSCPDQCGIV